MYRLKYLLPFLLLLISCGSSKKAWRSYAKKPDSFIVKPIHPLPFYAPTGQKPQSKLWYYNNQWRAVLSSSEGSDIWLLKNDKWIKTLHLSNLSSAAADVLPVGAITHILLYKGENSLFLSVEFDSESGRYIFWKQRREAVPVPLEAVSETATIAIDGKGRMWLASDDEHEMHVRWSDALYQSWSSPVTVASGMKKDDICAVTAFPDGNIGLMWSNQISKRFGFKVHKAGDPPQKWSADEVPAAQSAVDWQDGMADDHLNIAVAADGTLYAAVKTSYDTPGYPLIALLVRRPSGKWDDLYYVDDEGSRGIILLNEELKRLLLVYTSYRDNQIVCRVSGTSSIKFGGRHVLMKAENKEKRYNNVSSTKQNIRDEAVIIVSSADSVGSVILKE